MGYNPPVSEAGSTRGSLGSSGVCTSGITVTALKHAQKHYFQSTIFGMKRCQTPQTWSTVSRDVPDPFQRVETGLGIHIGYTAPRKLYFLGGLEIVGWAPNEGVLIWYRRPRGWLATRPSVLSLRVHKTDRDETSR